METKETKETKGTRTAKAKEVESEMTQATQIQRKAVQETGMAREMKKAARLEAGNNWFWTDPHYKKAWRSFQLAPLTMPLSPQP